MTAFRKPFIAPFAATLHNAKRTPRSPRCVFPYPTKLFKARGVFPLLVLDGGAFFITQDHLGGGDAARFIAALDDGSLLAPWLVRNRIQWDKALDDSAAGLCRPAFEMHVWLNRLYFLLPIAQQFLRTNDCKWADLWLKHFADWSKAHPYPEPSDSDQNAVGLFASDHAKHCWRDMQVTWRLIVLIHSVHLLESARSIKKSEWAAIYAAIRQHARHVYGEAARDLELDKGRGNHFLQKGVALLYAGLLFPEFPEASEFVRVGRGIVEQQMATEIHPDGGSLEASPSYSHFIARLYLEALLLLDKNGQPPIKGLKNCVQKQYRFLDETTPPGGRSLQLSDSYALDADADLDLVARLAPFARTPRNKSACFKDSAFAVLRTKRAELFVDGMALGLWHHHRGKPNLVIYADGRPLIVDSGCSNYDLEFREGWLKTAPAHNVVLVSPDKDNPEPLGSRDVPVIRVAGFEQTRDRSVVMMVHELVSDKLRYEWTRTVLARANAIEIIDRVAASVPVYARQVFHFAPVNVGLSGDRRQAAVQWDRGDIILRQAGGTGAPASFDLTWRPAYGPDNRITYSPELSTLAYGQETQFHLSLSLPS